MTADPASLPRRRGSRAPDRMTERRPAPGGKRRPAFSLRQTVLAFCLAAALLGGAGLALRSLFHAAGAYGPAGIVLAASAALTVAGFSVTVARSRRRTRPAVTARTEAIPVPAPPVPAEPGLGETEPGPADFGSMDPLAFERAVAALCERDGCLDVAVNGGAGDLGADVVATAPDGSRVVIQCKRYGPVNKVGSQEAQRFGGTCFAVHRADVAAIVTTGEFTGPATDYAEECGIRCVDHRALAAWADRTGPAPWQRTEPAPAAAEG